MELKFIVSIVLYYVYVYLKTRGKKNKTLKETFLVFDLVVFVFPFLYFINDDLIKMAIFIGIMMSLSLVEIYKRETPKEIIDIKKQIGILAVYSIPTIVYLFFFEVSDLIIVYCILGFMLYLYDFVYFLINKWKRKEKHAIMKEK